MTSNHLILCHPLLLLPLLFPSIRVFSNESFLLIRWPKYWSLDLKISPSNEHPALISFGMGWLHLLAVQGTLKSLLQHHSSKALILLCSAFFIVQLSHPHMTTGKTIAFTRQTFVGKVMSLLFNMLSRLVLLPGDSFYAKIPMNNVCSLWLFITSTHAFWPWILSFLPLLWDTGLCWYYRPPTTVGQGLHTHGCATGHWNG